MENVTWRVRCDEEVRAGDGVDIARAIAGLHHALCDLAAAAEGLEAEGEITAPHASPMPFWIRWGSPPPADCAEPRRDDAGTRSCIEELVEGLRDELHRAADQRVLASVLPG